MEYHSDNFNELHYTTIQKVNKINYMKPWIVVVQFISGDRSVIRINYRFSFMEVQ